MLVDTMISYERVRGVVLTAGDEYASLDELAAALAQDELWVAEPAARLAGFGLALAARQWQGRQPHAQLTAIVQAAAWLQGMRPSDPALQSWMQAGLRAAQAAMLTGADVEAALVEWAAQA